MQKLLKVNSGFTFKWFSQHLDYKLCKVPITVFVAQESCLLGWVSKTERFVIFSWKSGSWKLKGILITGYKLNREGGRGDSFYILEEVCKNHCNVTFDTSAIFQVEMAHALYTTLWITRKMQSGKVSQGEGKLVPSEAFPPQMDSLFCWSQLETLSIGLEKWRGWGEREPLEITLRFI